MKQDRILVIIITYNGMKWIDKCIQSILVSTIDTNIFIIDNGSTDNTIEHIEKNYPNVKINVNTQNLGFGQANNIGLQFALDETYDYVYLLNQDAWVKPDTFEKLINVHKKHPEYGILSPIQVQANEKHFDTKFNLTISNYDFSTKFSESLFFKQNIEIHPINRIMAAHWLISRDCLLKVGGFSPSFKHYGEDDNYADRAWKKGFMVGFSPITIAIHDRELRTDNIEKKTYFRYCQAISDISGFQTTPAQGICKFIYDALLSFFFKTFDTKLMFKYLLLILKNIIVIKKNKKESLLDCAFLNSLTKNN